MLEDGDNQHVEGEQTVMDEMLEVATRAKAMKQAARVADERKRSQTFGGGLKKGFFSNPKPAKKKSVSTAVAISSSPDIPTLRRNPAKESSLHLPEVHDAMNQMQNLKPEAMKNPRFTAAIQEMSTNPTAAILKYQLGKIEEKTAIPTRDDIQRQALTSMTRSPKEDAVVQRILADPELQGILGDPDMQKVLRACQVPGVLSKYMNDKVFGPKIQKLARAGLVQLHP
ncbi:hypothetical protein DYB28_007525 [Aphanomyces astaci]|uniref:STI1/HOP DP domain-containing protein n=2 Tax=Aphanomyces astaci TaxID=112090 RepID=A0A397D2D8_APHAT|nr:hypothetical protein DYB34_003407 [Aphanomyces astaci]RHY57469.1 hypothetical protein DYB30_000282 [Aphanomyces astaci]RLN76759.1 hypothetical protein DYB28_007525 [Aphanomyces astaci]